MEVDGNSIMLDINISTSIDEGVPKLLYIIENLICFVYKTVYQCNTKALIDLERT